MDNFVIQLFLAGTAFALLTGPISSIMLWRRLAFFGDAISHSALVGVAIALCLNLPTTIGALCVAVLFSLIAVYLEKRYSNDSLLAFFSYSALSLAVIIIYSRQGGYNLNINQYLFGDILAVSITDILITFVTAMLVIGWLIKRWQALLLVVVFDEFAYADNISPRKLHLEFMLVVAAVVTISFQIVGTLITSGMLIIPAMVARARSHNPEEMVLKATMASLISTLGGLTFSLIFDIPTGPAIIICSTCLFLLSSLCK